MKKVLFLILVFVIGISNAECQEPSASDRLVNDYVFSKIIIKKEKLDSEALSKVFSGAFYKALPTYNHHGGISSCDEFYVVVNNGNIFELDEISETKTLDQLFSFLRADFTLRDENDAKTFEQSLDAIYPLGWTEKPEDKYHFLKDGKWFFIRGEFFDSKKAFIVTIGQNYRITQIEYNLEAVKNQ